MKWFDWTLFVFIVLTISMCVIELMSQSGSSLRLQWSHDLSDTCFDVHATDNMLREGNTPTSTPEHQAWDQVTQDGVKYWVFIVKLLLQ